MGFWILTLGHTTHTHTYTTCIHQTVWDAFCNSWLFKLWRAYFHYEWLLEEKVVC